jgi:hypothetical protein
MGEFFCKDGEWRRAKGISEVFVNKLTYVYTGLSMVLAVEDINT